MASFTPPSNHLWPPPWPQPVPYCPQMSVFCLSNADGLLSLCVLSEMHILLSFLESLATYKDGDVTIKTLEVKASEEHINTLNER